jgi:hypothetical protein
MLNIPLDSSFDRGMYWYRWGANKLEVTEQLVVPDENLMTDFSWGLRDGDVEGFMFELEKS